MLRDRLIVIEEGLGQHGHGGTLGRVEGRVERGVAESEQLVRVGAAGAELVVLVAVERFERGELPRTRPSAGQHTEDVCQPIIEV